MPQIMHVQFAQVLKQYQLLNTPSINSLFWFVWKFTELCAGKPTDFQTHFPDEKLVFASLKPCHFYDQQFQGSRPGDPGHQSHIHVYSAI